MILCLVLPGFAASCTYRHVRVPQGQDAGCRGLPYLAGPCTSGCRPLPEDNVTARWHKCRALPGPSVPCTGIPSRKPAWRFGVTEYSPATAGIGSRIAGHFHRDQPMYRVAAASAEARAFQVRDLIEAGVIDTQSRVPSNLPSTRMAALSALSMV